MARVSKTLNTAVAVILVLAGIATGVQGFVPGGAGSFGGETRGPVRLRGTVVCARCTLDEVRKAQPNEHALYELTHRQGQVVMKVKFSFFSKCSDSFLATTHLEREMTKAQGNGERLKKDV